MPTEEPLDGDSILLLEDLSNWNHEGVSLAVLGHPIDHSISPAIHNAALLKMSLSMPNFTSWKYFRFQIPLDLLKNSLSAFSTNGFRGLNLTIPHKVEVLELVDWIDPEAEAMGAVNTLVFREDGRCDGFNTDGQGLERALKDDLDVSLDGSSVILLGAGGAARAAATRFLRAGCSELWIGNRSPKRLERLQKELSPMTEQRLETFALDDLPLDLPRGAGVLVVNATSLGLRPEDESPFSWANFSDEAIAYDMIYNPAETGFLQMARARGMRASNGLSMLIRQAAHSLEIWTGEKVPAGPMFKAAQAILDGDDLNL
ncbi:MAG: shikimate dehydrogenase [Opitutales bacterium]